MTPLRLELAVLAIGLFLCAWSGALKPQQLPYADPGRLVRLDRSIHLRAGLDSMLQEILVKRLIERRVVAEIASYRVIPGPLSGARVSNNFFDVLGTRAALGRTFEASDPTGVAVITDDLWRYRFHRDRGILGASVHIFNRYYRIVGVLPRNFWFSNERLWYYTPLPKDQRWTIAVARMWPGATLASTEEQAKNAAREAELKGIANSIEVLPVSDDPRTQDALFAVSLGSVGGALGLVFLLIRGRGGFLYRLLLACRLFLVLVALAWLWVAAAHSIPGPRGPYSFLQLWLFLLLCFAASCLIVRDHLGRCLVCFRRLRLPTPLGLWSSPILDQPGTEYVCPAGHGTLYIAETRNAPDHWSQLDESWRDLFAGTRR